MSPDQALSLLASLIAQIAPEIDLDSVDKDANFQEEIDLDSVDFLNLIEMIFEKTGLNISERDYVQLSSVNSFVAYLAAKAS